MIDIIFTYILLHNICIILTNAFDRLLTQKLKQNCNNEYMKEQWKIK